MRARDLRKRQSHKNILEAAGRLFRENGLAATSVADVMKEAGLTHGGFYAHFPAKTDLVHEAFSSATAETRAESLSDSEEMDSSEWLRRVIGGYLSRTHRDCPGAGCAFAALGTEISRQPEAVRAAYEKELRRSVEVLAEGLQSGDEGRAFALMALCIGGISMARAVVDPELSDQILKVCREFAADRGD